MRCKKYREQIVLYHYGDLSESERTELESHIGVCRECAHDFADTKEVLNLLNESKEEQVPEADWNKCWNTVSTDIALKVKKPESKKLSLFPGWVYAGAGLILIFVLGIAIGRFWLSPGSQPALAEAGRQSTVSPEYVQQSLSDHFETLKPLLVEYSNFKAEGNGKEPVTMDRETLESLLIQNYLLKKIVAESNPSAQQILDDLDLVLREIKNQRSDDTMASALIKDLIQERDILFKMDVMKTL
jgi:hypothetical protein